MDDSWRFRPSIHPPPPLHRPPPPIPFPDPWTGSPAFHPSAPLHLPKRIRVDDAPIPRYDASTAAERRLNLVRDHGRQSSHGPGNPFPAFDFQRTLPGPLFAPPPHRLPADQFVRFPDFPVTRDFPRSYDRIVPFEYRHNDVEIADKYVARDVGYPPQGYRQGNAAENFEDYGVRAPLDYRRDVPAVDGRGYRQGDHVGATENRYGSLGNDAAHRHGHGEAGKYAVSSHEDWPFHNSRPPLDSFPAYAPQGNFQEYRGTGRGDLQMDENLSFLNHKPYPHMYEGHIPRNVLNQEQESSNMFRDVRVPVDNRFEPHRQQVEVMQPPVHEFSHKPFNSQYFSVVEQSVGTGPSEEQQYPPLPPEPFPVLHPEPPPLDFLVDPPLPEETPRPSPAPTRTPAITPYPPNAYTSSGSHLFFETDLSRKLPVHASAGIATEGLPLSHQAPPKQYHDDGGQSSLLKDASTDKLTTVDAIHLFRQPYRASRPDHFVVILRGLPGSGKSYLAKALRDIEVENGGNAPRIHAMDDYFMTEVEKKIDDNDGSKSSRGRKQTMKKVIEYCYEPEMEEAYRLSMLKAFKKTLDEGVFTFIIVDDRNLRVADFAQFWAIAKRSGYEVYLLEAAYKDPIGCAARNVHGFMLDDISKMAEKWEEAPSLYLRLDIQSLIHGDNLNEQSIQEVDMDTDDSASDGDVNRHLQDGEALKMSGPKSLDYAGDGGLVKGGDRWVTEEEEEEEEEELTGVKELHKSKWSKELDEDTDNSYDAERNPNALSGLMQAYGKNGKSVHWGDRVNRSGFSIGAAKKRCISSLVIGPGSGYNLKSNPMKEEQDVVDTTGRGNGNESKRRFHEQLCAEQDSFKAVFDKRRHRIGGLLDIDDE